VTNKFKQQWEKEQQKRKDAIASLSEEARRVAKETGLGDNWLINAKHKSGDDPEAEVQYLRGIELWISGLPSRVREPMRRCKTDIDSLYPLWDRVSTLYPDGLAALNILTTPASIDECQAGLQGDVVIIGVVIQAITKDENSPDRVKKRGYALRGPTRILNLWVRDDSFDKILCQIDRYTFEHLGQDVIEKSRNKGRAIYAIKGTIPSSFRMIKVSRLRYLGDMDASWT
jgi:hypothetical protein